MFGQWTNVEITGKQYFQAFQSMKQGNAASLIHFTATFATRTPSFTKEFFVIF
jgi:hypothetical protein